ncbi:Peroxidase 5 [Abeliophyllum distichum]|uniref:peroxidase n=1 Tax=Abeliophyllum distichum TaxID=126358 RepID=A0ABD1NSS2_9LAMI
MHSLQSALPSVKHCPESVGWRALSFASIFMIALFRAVMHQSYLMKPLQYKVKRLHFQTIILLEAMKSLKLPRERLRKYVQVLFPVQDIITLAARDASAAVGGPSWNVKLGRRDSTTASRSLANTDLPGPASDLSTLISSFGNKGLTARGHGCLIRIYSNGTNIDAGFASTRRRQCPSNSGDSNLAPLDLVTPNSFDNNYYKNLMQRKGLLQSDQILFSGDSTDSIVSEYSRNQQTFLSDFGNAMIKMGEIEPLTGQNGIIRRICSAIN